MSKDKPEAAMQAKVNVPELIINASPLTLAGRNITIPINQIGWKSTGIEPAGAFAHRPASGGVPPYTFKSSNGNIASVDAQGTVRSVGNGAATITVSDAANQSKAFVVTTSNVITYLFSGEQQYLDRFTTWVSSVGGTFIEANELINNLTIINMKYQEIRTEYGSYPTHFRVGKVPDSRGYTPTIYVAPFGNPPQFIGTEVPLGWHILGLCQK